MRDIQVWMEGYAVTGNAGTANLLGVYEADNFDNAINLFLRRNELLKDSYKYINDKHYLWACQLFDNEIDARKRFG